nr:calsyntenin 1 [Hymenolepis microstoma]
MAVDSATLVDLLPDPTRNIHDQHIAPAVGDLPEAVPLSMGLRFSSERHTGWRLDTEKLLNAASVNNLGSEKVLPSSIFERDFTLSFWLQREPKGNDEHETILCSQEDTGTVSRAMWISLKSCRVMVQMTTRNPDASNPLMSKAFSTYFFPELPASVCQNATQYDSNGVPVEKGDPLAWHHYSISVTFESDSTDISSSSLLVDGELVGTLESFSKPIYFERPSKDFFPQFITVGTCYDPSIPSAQQSLNGALAGMTLLLGRNEDQSVSRCLAECGETLLIPRANRLITDDVTVLLNNDNIEIETVTAEEAAEMISNIAYVKPLSTSTQLTYEPAGSKDRVIEIVTVVRCGAQDLANISASLIPLIMDESISEPSVDSADPFYSGWMPHNDVIVQQSLPVAKQSKTQPKSTLVLAVIGEETIRAEIPVMEPGIIIFPGLEFTFTNVPSHIKSVVRSASMFIIDQCLVLPVNGSGLDFNDGERIVWPAGRAFELGVTVEPTQMGVLMKGRQTASQYASLLHGFSYWPPIEIEKRVNDRGLASGLLLERKFQLICSYNYAGVNTDPFTVQVLLSSPIVAKETSLNKNVVYSDNSRSNPLLGAVPQSDEDDDDDYVDEADFVDDALSAGDSSGFGYVQWPPYVMTYGDDSSLRGWEGRAQFAHSDKEVRPAGALGLHEKDQLKKAEGGKINTFGLAVGSGVACFTVMVIVIAFYISKSNGFRRGKLRFLRRGGSKAPGRSQFRPEARLNVIENPIEQMEGGKLNWQPPITTPTPTFSEGLPGVHVPYGARDEQFDAETRSFNGLFEEDEGNADEEIAAAVLEEVDDFDESELSQHMERIPGDTPRHQQEIEGDGDGIEDDEDTSFSVGPSHLDFVTLPGPRHGRGFNPDI